MKYLQLSFFLVLSTALFAQAQPKAKKEAQPPLKFTVLEIERQNIPYGSEDLFVFEFKNTSKKAAVITNVQTSCGCTAAERPETPIRKGKSYSQNAEIVDLLLSAGAIVMGKTATSELAYLGPSKTTNPHDYSRTPGGSSSGSAAAVASHMAPLSIGSQTNGSVIRPASYCGVVGYKPSYGLISRSGVLKQSDKLDHIGVFGKSVEDVALLTRVLIKKDQHDSSTIHYAADEMLKVCKKGPPYEPKFIFYKTKSWKKIDKESQKSFELFIKTFEKNIEVFDTPSYFDEIPKHHKVIHETDMANNFQFYYKIIFDSKYFKFI